MRIPRTRTAEEALRGVELCHLGLRHPQGLRRRHRRRVLLPGQRRQPPPPRGKGNAPHRRPFPSFRDGDKSQSLVSGEVSGQVSPPLSLLHPHWWRWGGGSSLKIDSLPARLQGPLLLVIRVRVVLGIVVVLRIVVVVLIIPPLGRQDRRQEGLFFRPVVVVLLLKVAIHGAEGVVDEEGGAVQAVDAVEVAPRVGPYGVAGRGVVF
mmetsp:Transcript_34689/g.111306  ORF Transcript_34689/g.111306 Transcript_34689/m.111306 type:complete len:207 (-) Transcript_34689:829-1449(-)